MDVRTYPDAPSALRKTLLSAISELHPRIVVCAAPAGYGKSVLAAQIGALYGRTVTCDCTAPGRGHSFARALLAALDSEAGAPLTEDSKDASPAARALQLWSQSGDPQEAFIFENAEGLDREALELLRKCLANPGRRGVVVVCTRTFVNVPFSRNLQPTAIMTIGESALCLSETEIAELVDADPSIVQRIAQRTGGWPAAVGIFQKAARLGTIERVFDDPDHIELRRLDGYISAELISPMREDELDVLCLLSLAPEIDPRVVAVALGMHLGALHVLVRGLPLIERRHHALFLQPLLARHLALHHRERRRAVGLRCSDALLKIGHHASAARLALAAGDQDRAAAAVDPGVFLVTEQPADIADYAAALDGETLVRQPRLWGATLPYRVNWMTPEQFHAEGFAAWKQLAPSTNRDTLIAVANSISLMLMVMGNWGGFEDFRCDAATRFRAAGMADDPMVRVSDVFWNGWLAAARLQPLDIESFMSGISPLLTIDYVHALALREIVARVRSHRGNRDLERDTLDEAVRRASRAGIAPGVSFALQEAILAAWIAGEETLVELYLQELRELADRSPEAFEAARHLLACVDGDALSAPGGGSRPALRAMAILMGAQVAEEPSVRGALIRTAVEAADSSNHLAPMIFTRLAAAAADPRERHRLDEIRTLLAGVPSGTIFHEALEKFECKGARLDALLDRFRPRPPAAEPVRVELLSGSVRRGKMVAPLSVREFGLLAFLAVQRRPVSIDVVIDALWPNASIDDGTASIRVYVNRIRKRIGDPSVIVSSKRAYGVGTHVSTDIAEFERLLAGLPESATRPQIEAVLAIHDNLAAGLPPWLVDLPGMSGLNARVNAMLDLLVGLLARSRELTAGDLRRRIDAALLEDLTEAATA